MVDDSEPPSTKEPNWVLKIKKTELFASAIVVGLLIGQGGNIADGLGKIYGLFKTPEAFVLTENSAKSIFSDDLAQRAWRRLFWAANFRARVVTNAPIADIDYSWKAYVDSDADWNANLMIAIVGVDKYYGVQRSRDLEDNIQILFGQLDSELAALRSSTVMRALRAGQNITAEQTAEAVVLSKRAEGTSDALHRKLYIMLRCFAPDSKNRNLC